MYKLTIEVDELVSELGCEIQRLWNKVYEIQRQNAIENELGFVFIRIKPDEEDFNIFKAINEIHSQ